MTDQKIQVEIAKGLESEESYKKVIPGVLKKINAVDKAYITNTIKLTNTIITNSKYDSETKYWALLLLKDIMQLNQTQFSSALVESSLFSYLESIVNKDPKTEQEVELIFGKQANPKFSKRFYVLLKECLKVWGLRYKDAKGSPQKFSIVYTNLTKKGIQFPTNYFFFPNKDKQDNKEQKGEVPGQATDQRVLAIIDKLRKNFENLEQEFYYNAQDLEEDPDFPDKSPVVNVNQQKAPVTQLQSQPQAQVQVQNPAQSQNQAQQSIPPEEELLPLMYNAQDLEVDGPDEYLYAREEVSNVKENKKVEKIIENPMEKSTQNNTKVSEPKYQSQIQGPVGRNQNEIQTNIGSSSQNNERNITNTQVIKERAESKGEIEDVKIKIDPNSIEEHVQGKTKLPLSQVGSLIESNRVRNDGSMTFKPGKDMSQSERNQGQGASSGQVEESLGNKKEKSILDLWKPKKPSEIQIPEYEPPNRTEDELPSTQQIKEINIKIQKDLIPTEEDERKNKAKKSIVDSRLEILSNYEKSEIKSMLSEPDSRKVADIRNSPPAGNKNINFPAQNKPPKLETPPARHQEDRILKKESPQQEKVRKRESPRAEKVIKKETPPFKKENVEVHRLKSNNIETYQSIESEREEKAFYKPQREGSSKGNVDIQRLKSGTIESYQSLDGDRSLSLKQRISPKSNTEREPKKKDSFEVFQSRSGNIGSYQSLEGERERKNTSILKQKDRISPKSGPFIPDRDLLELKQRNEFLATENQEIKARLKDLEHKMRDESEKTKLLQEQIEKRENSSFHGSILRSNSTAKKSSAKTEVASNPRNKFLSTEPGSDYFIGRSLSGPAHKTSRGRSPKVETFKTFNMTTNFGAELRRRNDWNIEPLMLSPQRGLRTATNFYSTGGSDFYSVNNRTRSEFSPAGTMIKTEFFQKKQQEPALWKKLNQALRKSFMRHEELPFSTNLYRFKLTCLKDQETLFENEHIKIDVVTYYLPNRSGTVVVELIYLNQGQNVIKDFSVTYKSVLGFEIIPEDTNLSPALVVGEKQIHRLNTEIRGYPQDVGVMVVEFKVNEEPCQYKLNYPLIATKFMDFSPVIGSEFVRKRKALLSNHPANIEESIKLKVNRDYLKVLQETLFSKLVLVPGEGGSEKRFTIYGGCFTLGTSRLEYMLRIILENETQLLLIQVAYPIGGEQDARLVLEKLVFLCNEYSLL